MRRTAIEKAYGFAFPDDLKQFWTVTRKHRTALTDAGVRLVGPFALLAKAKAKAKARPTDDLGRWPSDPPELFTVAEGDTDGLHWGYVLHDPGRAPGYVGSFYSRDGYPIGNAGRTLAEAIGRYVKSVASERRVELDEIRAVGENDRDLARSIERLDALAGVLAEGAPEKRPAAEGEAAETLDGLEARAPKNAFGPALDRKKLHREIARDEKSRAACIARGHAAIAAHKPGTALQIARDALAILPTRDQGAAVLLAVAAYAALGRPLLAKTFGARATAPTQRIAKQPSPEVDNRVSRSMAEALLDPSNVERLILEQWRGQPKTPDLDLIATFPKLQALVLRGYRLGDLPPSFTKLKALRTVELFHCALATFPAVLAKLPHLEGVKIVQERGSKKPTKEIAIPRGLALPKLQSLSLGGCGLRDLPAFVLGSKKLRQLSLDGNHLRQLPETISVFGSLSYLHLADNALEALPESLAKLKKLESLWLRENRLTKLPDAIGVLTSLALATIDVAGNPLAKNKEERGRVKRLAKRAKVHWA